MDAVQSYEQDEEGHMMLRSGTGGKYENSLRPGNMLSNILSSVPELRSLAQLELQIPFNKDSSNVGPPEWIKLATILHKNRSNYDAFLIVHGTDTMSFTASALSLMLAGFKKAIVLTGSQIPLALPRSDARQNLIDAATCAVASFYPPHVALQETAICFGGKLLRGNRSQKINSTTYQAFDSPSFPPLAILGVDIEWSKNSLLHPEGVYRPRLNLNPKVMRVSVIPGCDPRIAYGDLYTRGVRGVILEAFGVGNLPDKRDGWLPWLRDQRKKGMQIYMRSQSSLGPLAPHLYRSGSAALKMGVEAGPQMTPECAVVKMMLCLKYPDLPMGMPLAGEM
jgi:L-asparaginase